MKKNLKITQIITNLLNSNVYVVEKNGHCLIVDCGAEREKIIPIIGDKKVDGILLTHGHFDHCAFCNDYADKFNAKIYASSDIVRTMSDKDAIYSEEKIIFDDFSNFELINGDENLKIGEFDVQCFSTSGHSPCSECFLIDEYLFAGDVLFENGIGSVSLIGSDRKEMLSTLERLEKIDFTYLYSGHGKESDLNRQKKNIALFKRFLSR